MCGTRSLVLRQPAVLRCNPDQLAKIVATITQNDVKKYEDGCAICGLPRHMHGKGQVFVR